MSSIDTGDSGGKQKGGKVRAKKMATNIDFTPMVDLGFLLLTFFVFTTTMSTPKGMAMNEPKDDPNNQLKVKNSGAMTLLLGKDDHVFYYFGELLPETISEQFKSSTFKDIREIIATKAKNTPIGDLMYIIKANNDATFKNAIDILDEMTISNVPPGHYAEVDITPTEEMLIQKTEEANGGGK